MRRLLTLALPLVFLIPAYPSISLRLFQWREPQYRIPLEQGTPFQIRQDPYGSGLFGARRSGGRRHLGIDLVAAVGTPVLASKSGTVTIGRSGNGMGRYLEIRHPDGWRTRYGHLSQIWAWDRQRVRRGDPVGSVGKSGNARRRLIQSHLHFEIWNDQRVPVDPLTVMEVSQNGS